MAEEHKHNGEDNNDFDPSLKWDEKRTPPTLTYAWAWFSYHANQRLTAFHYFLIIVGILATGYATSLEKDLYLMQVILGLVGIIISLAFLALDVRNTRLVDDGREALWDLEGALRMEKGIYRKDDDSNHVLREKKAPLSDFIPWETISKTKEGNKRFNKKLSISHSFWLRTIHWTALVLFFFATIIGAINCYTARGISGPAKEYRVRIVK